MSSENESRGVKEAKKMKRIRHLAVLMGVLIVVLVVFVDAPYTLDVEHQAVVTTFGKASAQSQPGLHFKIPFVQKVKKVDTTVKGMPIGYVVETNEDVLDESIMISSDYNFLNVDFYLEYQVSDPVKYTYASNDPIATLKAAAQNCIRTVISSYKVDSILTTGKSEIQSNIKSMLIEKMDELDIGIAVRNISIQDSEPPTAEVISAFKDVETAKQGRETALNNANKYRNEQIPAAEAEVDKILQDAEAAKEERIAEAKGQVERFNRMYDEYIKYPDVTKQRMFYETMEDVLPSMKIVINGSGNDVQTVYPLEKFSEFGTASENKADTSDADTEKDTNTAESEDGDNE